MEKKDYRTVIAAYLSSAYYPYKTPSSEFYLQHFLSHFDGIACVYLYGSMLNPLVSTPTSFPDFYIIVDDYRRFYKSGVHTALNKVLPPNSYFLKLDDHGTSMPCKYCVLDTGALMRTTQYPGLRDFFIAGRLAKRIGILYTKDPAFLNGFIGTITDAMKFNVMFALSEMTGPFTLDEFIIHLLGLSYRAEIRTETQDKVISLYGSEKTFYQTVYRLFLEQAVSEGNLELRGGRYVTVRPYFTPAYTRHFISHARKRAVYRLPKSIYTFSHYVEYLELKIERTTGEPLVLSKWDRRFPLIFGWRHLFRLIKKKALR